MSPLSLSRELFLATRAGIESVATSVLVAGSHPVGILRKWTLGVQVRAAAEALARCLHLGIEDLRAVLAVQVLARTVGRCLAQVLRCYSTEVAGLHGTTRPASAVMVAPGDLDPIRLFEAEMLHILHSQELGVCSLGEREFVKNLVSVRLLNRRVLQFCRFGDHVDQVAVHNQHVHRRTTRPDRVLSQAHFFIVEHEEYDLSVVEVREAPCHVHVLPLTFFLRREHLRVALRGLVEEVLGLEERLLVRTSHLEICLKNCLNHRIVFLPRVIVLPLQCLLDRR